MDKILDPININYRYNKVDKCGCNGLFHYVMLMDSFNNQNIHINMNYKEAVWVHICVCIK